MPWFVGTACDVVMELASFLGQSTSTAASIRRENDCTLCIQEAGIEASPREQDVHVRRHVDGRGIVAEVDDEPARAGVFSAYDVEHVAARECFDLIPPARRRKDGIFSPEPQHG